MRAPRGDQVPHSTGAHHLKQQVGCFASRDGRRNLVSQLSAHGVQPFNDLHGFVRCVAREALHGHHQLRCVGRRDDGIHMQAQQDVVVEFAGKHQAQRALNLSAKLHGLAIESRHSATHFEVFARIHSVVFLEFAAEDKQLVLCSFAFFHDSDTDQPHRERVHPRDGFHNVSGMCSFHAVVGVIGY